MAVELQAIDARRAAVDIGMTPTALAACGADGEATQSVLVRLEGAEVRRSNLYAARQAVSDLLGSLRSARRLTDGSEESNTRIDNLSVELASARGSLEQARSELFTEALAALPRDVAERMRAWRSNTGRTFSPELRTTPRDGEEADAIQSGLISERLARTKGQRPPAEATAAVEQARNSPDARAATASVDANLVAVRARLRNP